MTDAVERRGLTDDEKVAVWKAIFQEHLTVRQISEKLNIPKTKIYAFMNTKMVSDQMPHLLELAKNKVNMHRLRIIEEVDDSIERMLNRVRDESLDVDGKPVVPPGVKNQIDFRIQDIAGLSPKIQIDVQKTVLFEVPDNVVKRINTVSEELGQGKIIEAEVVKDGATEPGPDSKT